MRVLMLARYLPSEGSTTHIYTLAKGLLARGHKVAIASAGHNDSESAGILYERSIADGVEHIRMPFPLAPSFGALGKLRQAAMYLAGTPRALSLIARWKPDVIHVHYPVTSFLAAIHRRRNHTRFVTTHHISGIPEHPLHRKADFAIAISSELRSELINNFGYDPENVALVHNGVEVSRFQPLKAADRDATLRSLGLEDASDKTIIGFVGSVNYRKGIDILLKAAAQLDRTQFQIVIVGDGELEWLHGLIAEKHLENNVSVFGFSDPEPFYSVFDVFVLPSRKEGFPLVVIEAMASKVLTVRSNVEGASDQIDHGETGFLFESENVYQLQRILQEVMQESDQRETIAAAGQEKVLARFSVDAMIDGTEILYEQLSNLK